MKIIYQADDGTIFNTELDCKEYEEDILIESLLWFDFKGRRIREANEIEQYILLGDIGGFIIPAIANDMELVMLFDILRDRYQINFDEDINDIEGLSVNTTYIYDSTNNRITTKLNEERHYNQLMELYQLIDKNRL